MIVVRDNNKGNKYISLVIALGFIVLGLVLLLIPKLKHLDCKEAVKATVVHVNTQKKPGHMRYEWPLYEYDYNGATIQYESEFMGNNSGYDEGDKETLYINPEKPDKAYEPYNKINLRNAFLLIGAGLLCFVIFIMNLFPKRNKGK